MYLVFMPRVHTRHKQRWFRNDSREWSKAWEASILQVWIKFYLSSKRTKSDLVSLSPEECKFQKYQDFQSRGLGYKAL